MTYRWSDHHNHFQYIDNLYFAGKATKNLSMFLEVKTEQLFHIESITLVHIIE